MISEAPGTPRVSDLLVVGAGPAGMAAAVTALAGGLTVDLLDSGHEVGGQYWRHPPREACIGSVEGQHHDLGTYRALRRHLEHHAATGRLRLRLQHHVWTAERTNHVDSLTPGEAISSAPAGDRLLTLHAVDRAGGPGAERAMRLSGRRLLVATGAFDRPLPFAGWELPGVYTAGALQALLKGNAVAVGSRVVVAGTGPFLLPVAVGLIKAGAHVVAVCEAASFTAWATKLQVAARVPGKLAEGAEYAVELARHRVPLLQRTAVVAAQGEGQVESVTLARLDRAGRVVPGSTREMEADAVGVGWGFMPQLDLAITLGCGLADGADRNQVVQVDDSGRASVPGVYAAGEVSGVGGAVLALREGQLAAEAIHADAGLPTVASAHRLASVRGTVARHRAFAEAMHKMHPIPQAWTGWLPDSATVCRCEEIDAGAVRRAVAAGALDVRQVKQLTRAGMGWCQGRMCAPAVDGLVREGAVASATVATRPSASIPRPGAPAATKRPAAATVPVVPASERLVASPIPLGALAVEEDG